MYEQRRWPREAWVPIATGMAWLAFAASFGLTGFLFSLIPGCLLLSSGVSTLLYAGDQRIPQYTALGGLLGVFLALPAFWVAGFGVGAALVLGSAASFVAAGMISVRQEPHYEDVPEPRPSLALGAQVAIDDTLLATMGISLPMIDGDQIAEAKREVLAARERYDAEGWIEKPEAYHVAPPALEDAEIRQAELRGLRFEKLSFDSGYEPWPHEPGRDRWLGFTANRTARAWVVRGDPEKPWMVCIHGYQMGRPSIDLGAFRADRLQARGLNLLFPVLPLHGARKIGRICGDGFLGGNTLDSIHAEAQAIWDMRRLLGWIRAQGGSRIGVHGLSLGGYNAALLASLADDLACAIAGIPLSDMSRAMWRHGPPLRMRYLEAHGVVHELVSELLRVVSPLAIAPRVPHERRYIYGAVADRLVPADQVRDLWRHWERPRIVWYQGSHVTFSRHPEVGRLVEDAMRESGITSAPA